MRLRTVDRLMLREMVPPLLFGVAAFTTLFFAGGHLARLTNLLVQGVQAEIVLRILLLYLPGVVVLTLPMSVLLAVLLSFSRLSSDSEIVALWAGGVSMARLMVPVLGLASVVTLLSYFTSEWIAPGSHRKSSDLMTRALGETAISQKPFIISDLDGEKYNAIVIVNKGISPGSNQLRDVTIFSGFTDAGPELYMRAERARWEGGSRWRLFNGMWQRTGPGGTVRNSFSGLESKPVEISRTPQEIIEEQRDSEDLTFGQLARRIQRLRRSNADTRELEVDLYNRFAVPLASVVFALLAAPLGMRPHRGGSAMGFGLSVALIFGYWTLWSYGSALAKSGQISPMAGSFAANLVFLAVGAALLARASR